MATPAFRGIDHLPTSAVMAASADYKSVDPASIVIEAAGERNAPVGLAVVVDVTAASGGGGVTVTIERWLEGGTGGGKYVTVLASALIASTGTTVYVVDPRIATAANVSQQAGLSPQMRIRMVGSGTRTTLTYSVDAFLYS